MVVDGKERVQRRPNRNNVKRVPCMPKVLGLTAWPASCVRTQSVFVHIEWEWQVHARVIVNLTLHTARDGQSSPGIVVVVRLVEKAGSPVCLVKGPILAAKADF